MIPCRSPNIGEHADDGEHENLGEHEQLGEHEHMLLLRDPRMLAGVSRDRETEHDLDLQGRQADQPLQEVTEMLLLKRPMHPLTPSTIPSSSTSSTIAAWNQRSPNRSI